MGFLTTPLLVKLTYDRRTITTAVIIFLLKYSVLTLLDRGCGPIITVQPSLGPDKSFHIAGKNKYRMLSGKKTEDSIYM